MFIPIMGLVVGLLTTLSFFVAVVLTVKYISTARNKEKMALIEKGVDISAIYQKKDYRNATLKTGMFLVGVALGLLAGYFLAAYTTINTMVARFSMVLLFGGISLIVFHFYNNKLSE